MAHNQDCDCSDNNMLMQLFNPLIKKKKRVTKKKELSDFVCGMAVTGFSIALAIMCRPFLTHIFTFFLGVFTTLAYSLLVITFFIVVLIVAGFKWIRAIVKCIPPELCQMIISMGLALVGNTRFSDKGRTTEQSAEKDVLPTTEQSADKVESPTTEESADKDESTEIPNTRTIPLNNTQMREWFPAVASSSSSAEDKTCINHTALCKNCDKDNVKTKEDIAKEKAIDAALAKLEVNLLTNFKDNPHIETLKAVIKAENNNIKQQLMIILNNLPLADLEKFLANDLVLANTIIATCQNVVPQAPSS